MSPFDTIFGTIMVGLCAAWLLALLVVGLCRAAAKPAPQPNTRNCFEASHYGPVRRMCELRGHQYGLSSDGRYWVCVRGDDRVARVITDLDDIERYANGGAA
jgi:hypothetical protein